MSAWFEAESGFEGAYELPREPEVLVVGYSMSADFPIHNRYVSRQHFQIRRQNDDYYIQDLNSTNGTYLNDEKLEPNKEQLLRDKDKVVLGLNTVVLSFFQPSKPRGTISQTTSKPMHETIKSGDSSAEPTQVSKADVLFVNSVSRDVWIRGERLNPTLSKKEFDILECLYKNTGKVVSRDEIGTAGWPEREDGSVASEEIDQYISRLRRKIEQDPSDPKIIVTRINYGYIIR
jgi:DNA-binding response OmpR family regulator